MQPCFSQYSMFIADSTYQEIRIERLNRQLQQKEIRIRQLSDSIDELANEINKELAGYKAKEDYFAVALEDQSNRFALIVTVLLALLTIAGIFSYKREIKAIKKYTKKQVAAHSDEFERHKRGLNALAGALFDEKGNVSVIIAKDYVQRESYAAAVDYFITAAFDRTSSLSRWKRSSTTLKVNDKRFMDTISLIENHIGQAMNQLDLISLNEQVEYIRTNSESIFKRLDSINEIKDKGIRDLIATLRFKINAKLQA